MYSSSSRALLAAIVLVTGSLAACGSGSPVDTTKAPSGESSVATGENRSVGRDPSRSEVDPSATSPVSGQAVPSLPPPAVDEPAPEPAWVEITGVTAQAPGNSWLPAGVGGPWAYLRNVFSPAGLVDARDYRLQQWHGALDKWPGEFRFEWAFPNFHPGDGQFCWGYPALMYGAGPWGHPWGTTDHPAPVRAGSFETFTIDVDLAFEGSNGADVLIDVYTLPHEGVFTGENVNEVSILLSHNGVGPATWLTTEATATRTFASSLGDVAIYKQPTSTQIMVMPRTGGDRREVLEGRIDVKEVLDYLVSIGQVDADAWVAGFEIGVETQRPNPFNSGPYAGSLTFRTAPIVVWR